MFYKKFESGINPETCLNGNSESVLALYQNCPDFLNPSIIQAQFKRQKAEKEELGYNYFLCFLDKNQEEQENKELIKKQNIFLNEKGSFSENALINITQIDSNKLKENINYSVLEQNYNVLKTINFQKIAEKGSFKDKKGKNYQYYIIQNADPTIDVSSLIVDKLHVFNEDNLLVGRLMTKYTNKKVIENIYKNLEDHLDENEFRMTYDYFNNCASVDYADILPSYQNMGIGKQMYRLMIDYTINNGSDFRPSSIQSELAQNLWNSLSQEYDFVKRKTSNNKNVSIIQHNIKQNNYSKKPKMR